MEDKRAAMEEELSKLQQIQGHLAALEEMSASFPEDHSTRQVLESLKPGLVRAQTAIKEDIETLRESLGPETM